jgi:geranylgeranyl diphosphate synthase type I
LGGNDGAAQAEVLVFAPSAPEQENHVGGPVAVWRDRLRADVLAAVAEFVANRCATDLVPAGIDVAADVLQQFVGGGKCLRSTFAYLGWLCGAADDQAALRAAASFELLHAFALLQDDVMDGSTLRRGRPTAHIAFAQWHRDRRLSGSAERFGESAAVLLGDLCLVWAERMLRESGIDSDALSRAWPHYDAMRTELAVGQFADLVNHSSAFPTLAHVLDVSRRKSGNYTVRRPLEIGAMLSGCGSRTLTLLGHYGAAVGEAFQLRDDVLGVFGVSTITGKPAGGDLAEQKATSVVIAAHHLADASTRHQLCELMSAEALDDNDVRRWRSLIAASGALDWIEQQIDSRITRALDWIDTRQIDVVVRAALADMAAACAERAA